MLTFRHSSTESHFLTDRGFKADLLYKRNRGVSYPGWDDPGKDEEVSGGNPFRRRGERRTGVSRNTSPVWCVACARSPPHVRAPSESADSGPPPLGTTREASAASQSASGFLQRGRQRYVQKRSQPAIYEELYKMY